MTITEIGSATHSESASPPAASEVLNRAADLLSEWDWCQGAARRGDAICAEGAIWFAVTNKLPHGEFVEAPGDTGPEFHFDLCESVLGRTGTDYKGLFLWNDVPGRTKAEVVALLRKCAEEEV